MDDVAIAIDSSFISKNGKLTYGLGTLLVIHGTPHPRMRVNPFTNELRRTTNPIPSITPSENPDTEQTTSTAQDNTVLLHIPPDTANGGNQRTSSKTTFDTLPPTTTAFLT